MEATKRPDLPQTVQEAREQRKLLREQVELRKLQHQERLLESLWYDAFGGSDLYDRVRPRDQGDWQTIVPSVASDRRHGANWPFWRTLQELNRLRQTSRILAGSNAYAKGLIRNATNYVLSKGFGYKAQAKSLLDGDPATDEGDDLKAVVRQVQDFIDEFLKRNRWNGSVDYRKALVMSSSGEREVIRRVYRDGGALVRFYFNDDGSTDVRFMELEQLADPPGASPQDGWFLGIRHQMRPYEDIQTPEEYHLVWKDPTATGGSNHESTLGELVPADQILHVKSPDTDASIEQGLPELSYDTADALSRAAKGQRNLSAGSAFRAATAEIWQFATASQGEVQNLADALAVRQTTNPHTGRTENIESDRPATVRRIPQGMELKEHTVELAGEHMQAVRGDLMQAGAGVCMPEHVISSNAENGDYSSTKMAGAPWTNYCLCDQDFYKSVNLCVVWKAIAWAVECGRLPGRVLTDVDVQVDATEVIHQDKLEAAQVRQIDMQAGILSPQTACSETGRDYEIETANIEEHQERTGGLGNPLQLPPEDEQGGGQPPGKPPQRQPVRESKDSSGHEHKGKGPGGGQFTGGGDGGKDSKPAKVDAYDVADKAAKSHYEKQAKMLRAMQQGKIEPDAVVENADRYYRQAEKQMRRGFGDHYRMLTAQVEEHFPPEAVDSPEWAKVKSEFSWAIHHARNALGDVADQTKAIAGRWHKDKKAITTKEMDGLRQGSNEVASTVDDAFKRRIIPSIDAFKEKWKPSPKATREGLELFESLYRRAQGE